MLVEQLAATDWRTDTSNRKSGSQGDRKGTRMGGRKKQRRVTTGENEVDAHLFG